MYRFRFENNTRDEVFNADTWPLALPLLTDGKIVSTDAELLRDDGPCAEELTFLNSLQLTDCSYGAAACPMHPFLCPLVGDAVDMTAGQILESLGANQFRSEHIVSLDVPQVVYPGYQPGTLNDEIHNDYSEQIMFCRRHEDEGWPNTKTGPIGADENEHGKLKRYVRDEQLWYVLLHSWVPTKWGRRKQPWVVVFAVGLSASSNVLLGCVSHQFCRNCCD